MLTKTLLAFCLLCAFVLIGCSKTETMSSNNTNTMAPTKASTPATTTSTTAAGDKIGVPECDDYIAKYEACITGKVPEMARGALDSALKTARDNWRKAAATPEGKAGLAAACKQATEAAKTSMKSYGCTF